MNTNILAKFPKNVLEMSTDERMKFLDSFDIVFSDVDGVIWDIMPPGPIPGVSEGIEFLQSKGKKVVYVTNNSLRPIKENIKRFHEYGIPVKEDDIVHPAQSIVELLKQIKFTGLIYCLASTSFKDHLRNAGFELMDGPIILDETFTELVRVLFDNHPVKAVIMDIDFTISAVKLMKAHIYLKKDSECLLIGGAADPLGYFANHEIIGNGPFINLVENSSKVEAKVLGKPGLELIKFLKSKYGIEQSQRALFVGDSPCSDVKFGKISGFQTMAVLTGGAKLSDLKKCLDDESPDFYINSLADFKGFL
ncbi:hypothetical protein ACFFRR_001671 [Megaselia abdita]